MFAYSCLYEAGTFDIYVQYLRILFGMYRLNSRDFFPITNFDSTYSGKMLTRIGNRFIK